ncbi:Transporter [Sandaracinus amylolyticus]|uniref:Transporter n=1 Tax=Sandaracinus amylolyticus TaxID=927083 RepID=A0A0F6VYY2_9BACT|nr:Transporter [Sandaracinus amylolyticus]
MSTGCVGVLDSGGTQASSRRDGGREVPRDPRDGGAPIEEVDATTPPPLDDAGTSMPPPAIDAATPPAIDAGPSDPCGGLTLAGRCDGDVARWCEDGAIREQSCSDGCGVVEGRSRCLPPPPPPPTGCASAIEAAELALTNAARREAGLSDLVCDEGLARAARLHSQDMCNQNYFMHDSLDGRSFVDRIDEQGVSWRTVGENIAHGYTTPEAVHTGWMNSDGHRRNILNGAFGRIGIGYVECGGRPYWTQDFAN